MPRLFESLPNARFYHHPHWYQCIANHLIQTELQLGCASLDGQIQLVLPLADSDGSAHRIHPDHDHLSLNDIAVHPQLAIEHDTMLDTIMQVLTKTGSNWSDWKINNVPHHSSLIEALAKNQTALNQHNAGQLSFQTIQTNTQWLFKKSKDSASFDCTSAECPPHGKLRRNLRRLRKQMSENGEVRVDNITSPDKLSDAFEHFLNVEASGWKNTGNEATAIAANPELTAFYRALCTPSTHGVNPEINLLWSNDECYWKAFWPMHRRAALKH